MKRVIVTGAGGFIGGHLLKEFSADYSVTAVSRRPLETVEPGCRNVAGDLSNRQTVHAMSRLIQNGDIFIHAAGQAHLVQSAATAARIWSNNVTATESALALALEIGAKRFIHVSSVSVLQTGKKDLYAAAKREAENRVRDFCANNNLSCTVIRPFVVYGEGDRNGNVQRLIRQMRRGWLPIIDGGTAIKPMLYVRNLTAWIKRTVETNSCENETVTLADSPKLTFRQVCGQIESSLGKPCFHLNVPGWLAESLERMLGIAGHAWPAAGSWGKRIGKMRESGAEAAKECSESEIFCSSFEGIRRTVEWQITNVP